MLGQLTEHEIERLLRNEVVGRIGCTDGAQVYIVPISYTYDGDFVYCHTHEGMKIHFMRQHPEICFEVDQMRNMANWQSVIAKGFYEELTDPALRSKALEQLHKRILPMPSSETTHLSADWPFLPNEINKIQGITFRIRLGEKTGRYEKSQHESITFYSI